MIPPLFSRIDNPSNIFEKESWGLGVRASRSRKGRKSDAAPQEDRVRAFWAVPLLGLCVSLRCSSRGRMART